MMEIPNKRVFMEHNEDVKFRARELGGSDVYGAARHSASQEWFEETKLVIIQRVMCSGEPKALRNDTESNEQWIAVRIMGVLSN